MIVEICEVINTESRIFEPGEVISVSAETATKLGTKVRQYIPVAPLPKWQQEFCQCCEQFNGYQPGQCRNTRSIDDCPISKIIEAHGDADKLRGEFGQGITFEQIVQRWRSFDEPDSELFKKPLWFGALSEQIRLGKIELPDLEAEIYEVANLK
jgi:hypothetical protein